MNYRDLAWVCAFAIVVMIIKHYKDIVHFYHSINLQEMSIEPYMVARLFAHVAVAIVGISAALFVWPNIFRLFKREQQ